MNRSKIQSLPDELKVMVASSITDLETLTNLAFVDKGFYNIVKGDEARLCARLFRKYIGDEFLCLAVAVAHSRALQRVPRTFYGQPRSRLDLSVEDIIDFVDIHFPSEVSDAIVASDWNMSLKLCAELFAFHEVVDNYADIISRPPEFESNEDGKGSEKHRVRKALYILQLLSNLFPRGRVSQRSFQDTERAYEPAWAHLLTRFAPWELQQARCAKQLLARHVQQGKPMLIYLNFQPRKFNTNLTYSHPRRCPRTWAVTPRIRFKPIVYFRVKRRSLCLEEIGGFGRYMWNTGCSDVRTKNKSM